jgi:hypothetical protein
LSSDVFLPGAFLQWLNVKERRVKELLKEALDAGGLKTKKESVDAA